MGQGKAPANSSPLVRLGQLATFFGVLLLIALLVYGLTTQAADTSIDQGIADASPTPAPGFELDLLEPGRPTGEPARTMKAASGEGQIALDELRGTPIVLNFWASWCAPCREEAPLLERGWQRWRDRGVLFLGLNMQDVTGDARAFLDEFSIDYPTIRDPGDSVSTDYGLAGIPETYFIDARGRAVSHAIGVLSREQLTQGVQAARSGEAAAVFSGGDSRPPR